MNVPLWKRAVRGLTSWPTPAPGHSDEVPLSSAADVAAKTAVEAAETPCHEPKLVYIHIPKTGGMSFTAFLADGVRPRAALSINAPMQITFLSDDQLNGHELITSHTGVIIFNRLRGNYKRVTLLRDPVERVLSLYYYQRSNNVQTVLCQAARTLSLEEFVQSKEWQIVSAVRDHQTWMLFHDPSPIYRLEHKDTPPETILDTAKRTLAGFDCVGFLEDYEASLAAICTAFGWERQETRHINKTETRLAREEISAATLRVLESSVELDRELYAYARSLWTPPPLPVTGPGAQMQASPGQTPPELTPQG